MKNKYIIIAVAAVIVIAAGIAIWNYLPQAVPSAGNGMETMPTSVGTAPEATTTNGNQGEYTVTIRNFSFSPQTLTVPVGTTVTWKQMDSVPHTVTAGDGSFGSGTLAPGGTFTHTFTSAGTYDYGCTIHPSMQAKIVVE